MASIQKKLLVLVGKMVCAALSFISIVAVDTQAQCVASGPNSPGTATSTGSGIAFSSPTNVFAPDLNRAVASPFINLFSGQTEDLRASNFGFSIPLTAIICGIEVEVQKSATNIGTVLFLTTSIRDNSVRLLKGGSVTGSDYAKATNWTTSETYHSYGGPSNLWGTTWMPGEVNASNFGVSFSAGIFDLASLTPGVRINHIRITVHYYEPPLLAVALQQFNVKPGKDHSALLQWKTSDWNSSIRFAIQRSTDNTTWETIAGFPQNDIAGQQYNFTDPQPIPGLSYYRLAMSYATGEIKYSVSQSLVMPAGPTVHCYPNPFISSIQLTGVRAGERVLLTDVFGKQISLPNTVVSGSITTLELSHLKPGVYFVWAGNSRKRIVKL